MHDHHDPCAMDGFDRERIADACLAAAATGATVCSIQFLAITGGFTGANAPISTVLVGGLIVFVVMWLVAGLGFLIGLQVVAPPTAAFLERRGQATPITVAVVGALLSAGVAGSFGAMAGGASGAMHFGVFLLLPGALSGWMFQRITRRGVSPP